MTTAIKRRSDAIDEVRNAVCRDRCKTHGDAEDSFELIATVWTLHLRTRGLLAPGAALTALDAAHMQASMKLARASANMNHRDHWVDIAGYAICGTGIYEASKMSTYAPEGDKQRCEFTSQNLQQCILKSGHSCAHLPDGCGSTKSSIPCPRCGNSMIQQIEGMYCPNPSCV